MFLLIALSDSSVSPPYLDGNQLCQDHVETMEDIDYDEEIRCSVKMKRVCDPQEQQQGGDSLIQEACHTMYKKECRISYKPEMTKVKVRVCPGQDEIPTSNGDSAHENGESIVKTLPTREKKHFYVRL